MSVTVVLQMQLMMLNQARFYAFHNLTRPNVGWMKAAKKGAEAQVNKKNIMFLFSNL
jgi:hypothetical protein